MFVKGLNTNAKQLTLSNMLGQNILNFTDVSIQRLVDGIHISNLSSGLYLVSLRTTTNQIIDKKFILD